MRELVRWRKKMEGHEVGGLLRWGTKSSGRGGGCTSKLGGGS